MTDRLQWCCPACDRTWITGPHIVAHYHACLAERRPSSLSLIDALPDTREERNALWFQVVFGAGKDTSEGNQL